MASSSSEPPPDSFINQEDGKKYWQGVSADVDGMLGGVPSMPGFSQMSSIELRGSRAFLAKLGIGSKAGRQKVSQVLEGGAGFVLPFSFISLWGEKFLPLPYMRNSA